MDKIAVISDIHGNLEALKTTINNIKKRGINKIYCLGDIIAKGSNSHECIKLIKKNCEVVVQGNTDEFFSRDFSEEELALKSKDGLKRIKWNQAKLTEDDKEYLRKLPYCYEFYFSGKLIRLFHATPTIIDGFRGHFDKIEHYYELLKPSDKTMSQNIADVVIYGHSHMQEMQKLYNRTIINTGSVGNPIDVFRNDKKDGDVKNTVMCNYVILTGKYGKEYGEISYEFVNIPYDIEKEIKTNDKNIEKEDYINELRYGKYRDMKRVYKSFSDRGIDASKI